MKISKSLLLLFISSCMALSSLTATKAAGNPYPTTQNVDGDNYYEIPCTYFAWQQAYEKTGIALPAWGNAGSWYSNAAKAGYSVGSTPKANSIAVWTGDIYGHVAYVTSVSSGSTFTVNEGGRTDLDHTSSKGVAYGYTLTNAVGQRRPYDPGKTLVGFIYLNTGTKPPKPDLSKTIPSYTVDQSTGKVTINWNHAPYSDAYRVYFYDTRKNTKVFTSNNLYKPASNKLTYSYQLPNKGLFYFRVNSANPSGGTFTDYFPIYYTGNKVNVGTEKYVRLKNRGAGKYVYYDDNRGMVTMKTLDNVNDTRYLYKLLRQSDGTYKIQSVYNPLRYMDIKNNANTNGTWVVLNEASEAVNPKFNIYSSSNGGYVIAKSDGKTVFDGASTNGNLYTWEYVNSNNQYQYFEFENVNASPQSVSLSQNNLTMNLGISYKLNYDIYPKYASKNVTWRTGNSKVATVDKNGKVTARGIGNTWLYIKTQNGKEARCLIKVINPAKAISLNYSQKTISVGTKTQFKAQITPSNTTSTVTWRIGNARVATVDQSGKVVAKSAGSTWLYAKTSNGLEAKALIKVIPAAKSVKITNTVNNLKIGGVHTFKAIVAPSGAPQNVTWRTGNSKVATVDKNGKVTARGIGSTWLYVKTQNGKEAKHLIKVINPAKAISLNYSQKTISVGTKTQFKAQITPYNTTSTVTWRTGNTRVATVDQSGKVVAKSVGSTWLYAKTSDGKEAKALIKVIPAAKSVKITNTVNNLKIGGVHTFKAIVDPSGAPQNVTWRTGNSKVATVDKNGKVRAKSVGKTWLYAKTSNGKEAKVLVQVVPLPKSVKIVSSSNSITIGKTVQYKAVVNPSNASQAVTWRIGNSKIATVDKYGKVTAKSIGKTWLYAKTCNGKEAKVLVQVLPLPSSVKIVSSSSSIAVGKTAQYKAVVNPSNASQAVTWRIGNSKIATVDKYGKVTAKSVGKTWLYAKTSNGKEAKHLITITSIPNPQSIQLTYKGYAYVNSIYDKPEVMWYFVTNETMKEIGVGNKIQFGAIVNPYEAAQSKSWRTGNPKVASVDQNGLLTANGLGSTWLYVKANNGIEAKILIKVKENNSFTEGKSKRINVGKTYQLSREHSLVYKIGNPKIATVDRNGKVTGKSVGNTWLYATSFDGEESKILIKVDMNFTKTMTPAETNKIKNGDIITQYPDLKTLVDKDLYYKLDEETGKIRLVPLDVGYRTWSDTWDISWKFDDYDGPIEPIEDQALIKLLEAMPEFIEAKANYPTYLNGRIDYKGNGVWSW